MEKLFTPAVYLSPKIIQYGGKTVIHVHILPSAEVHSYKKVIYDRVDDADVKVTSTAQIAQMYIRKQEIFTERKVYPYVKKEELRLDLLFKLRVMAEKLCLNQNTLKYYIKKMREKHIIERVGSSRKGKWIVCK